MDPQPPPPPPSLDISQQQVYTAHLRHGSVGPVIAVLAMITVLGIIAGIVGRLCSGRPVMGVREYDFEGWVETKCSSCIDGRVGPPPPPPRPPPPEVVAASSSEEVPEPAQVETSNEIKEEQQPQAKSHADAVGS